MGSNTKGIIAVLITGAIVYLAYKKFYKKSVVKSDVDIIIERLDSDFVYDPKHSSFVKSADKGYVESWANAIKSGSSTFMYMGKTYNTKGGSAVK